MISSENLLISKLWIPELYNDETRYCSGFYVFIRRDDWIRTSDPYVPNVVRYRAALHPEDPSIKKSCPPRERLGGQCRVDWIRTSDPLHPIQVRYRAAPPPELYKIIIL
jgi:hypothetical protein